MSILKVDTINEKTSGNGVAIPGHVIQVVNSSTSTQVLTTSTSFVDTGLTASITPKFSSSKIFVTVSQAFSITASTNAQRQANLIIADGSNNQLFGGSTYDQFRIKEQYAFHWQTNLQMLHSPSTTSSFTYKTRMKAVGGFASANIGAQYGSAEESSITLMEIAQ
tara:strand:+ start:4950 stop:5444 length:495 start_codon:yes stop_codon:yes gene_type:complete